MVFNNNVEAADWTFSGIATTPNAGGTGMAEPAAMDDGGTGLAKPAALIDLSAKRRARNEFCDFPTVRLEFQSARKEANQFINDR